MGVKKHGEFRHPFKAGEFSVVIGGDESRLSGEGGTMEPRGSSINVEMDGCSLLLMGGNRSAIKGGDNSVLIGGDRSLISGGENSLVIGGEFSTISAKLGSLIVFNIGGERFTVDVKGSVETWVHIGHGKKGEPLIRQVPCADC